MDINSTCPVLADRNVAAFYDFLLKSNQFYCQKDLETLMKKFGIRSSKHKEVTKHLLDDGLLRSERFKTAIILWGTRRSSGSEADGVLELLEVERAKLRAIIDECQNMINNTEISLGKGKGNGNLDFVETNFDAIQQEIDLMNRQVEAKKDEVMRRMVADIQAAEDSIQRHRTNISALQRFVNDTYLVSP